MAGIMVAAAVQAGIFGACGSRTILHKRMQSGLRSKTTSRLTSKPNFW